MFQVISINKSVRLCGMVRHARRVKPADFDLIVGNQTFYSVRVAEHHLNRGIAVPDRVIGVHCTLDSFALDAAVRKLAGGFDSVRFLPVGQGPNEPFEMQIMEVTPIVELEVKSAEPRCTGRLHCTLRVDGVAERSFEASEVQRSGESRALYISRADIRDQCFIAEQLRAGRRCQLECVPVAVTGL